MTTVRRSSTAAGSRKKAFASAPSRGSRLAISAGCLGGRGFGLGKGNAFGLGADRRQNGDHDRDRSGGDRQRQSVVSAVMRGDAGLKRRVHRRDQVAELINETGKRSSRFIRR